MLKKFAIASVAVLIASVAMAATLTMSWENATKNTDGSDIPTSGPGALTSTTVVWGTCTADKKGVVTELGSIVTPYPGTAPATKPTVAPGEYCAYAYHSNTYGEVSAPTDVLSVTKPNPVPGKPQNFSFGL